MRCAIEGSFLPGRKVVPWPSWIRSWIMLLRGGVKFAPD
jgi:hypothetical protein